VRNKELNGLSFDFDGTGFALMGRAFKKQKDSPEYEFEAELYIDGTKVETAKLPTANHSRRHELFWKLNLSPGKHSCKIVVKNPDPNYELRADDYVVYGNKPASISLK
jgi:hypothetical protein